MELKLPPAVIFFIVASAMYILQRFLPVGEFHFFGQYYLSFGLFTLGTVIGLVSVGHFFKSKTTVNPLSPNKASNLVISGIFAYSRNPMYLGLLLILLAIAAYFGNAFNILLAAGFVSYLNKYQIIPEEKALVELFGKEYTLYKKQVRRWF